MVSLLVVFTVPASQRSSVHLHLVLRPVSTPPRWVESPQWLEVSDVGSEVNVYQAVVVVRVGVADGGGRNAGGCWGGAC